ncbi:TPA: hypothetical protein HA241_05455, partial [Candidatus Woesearchaeota archaeon]|nr:hypothetical protein [Candidatus Woesearchaeota archaeon]
TYRTLRGEKKLSKENILDLPSPNQIYKLVKQGNNAFCIIVVDVQGKKDKIRKRIRYEILLPDLQIINTLHPGATYISYPTGVAAAVFTSSLSRIKKYGVFPPEAVAVDVQKYLFEQLQKSGLGINVIKE